MCKRAGSVLKSEKVIILVANCKFQFRIHLTSDLFNANVSGDHDPSGGFFDFCGRKMLFLVRNMDTGEVVLFGRKDHTDNKCE